ncbi:hypothetical protein R6Q57_001634 [Mikania cordata]
MLQQFYKKQLRLEEELDMPPNLNGYDIEMMHFYLIVKYIGGYEKVTKEERWLDVVDRMGLQVYMVRRVELCYMKYFGILDSYYKTMKNEGVGTSKSIKEGVEAVVTVGQFGSKEQTKVAQEDAGQNLDDKRAAENVFNYAGKEPKTTSANLKDAVTILKTAGAVLNTAGVDMHTGSDNGG